MSAFTVTKQHIDAIVTPVVQSRMYNGFINGADAQEIGNILWNQNYRSVNYRYHDNQESPKYYFKQNVVSPVQVLKLISCLDYQSCETPDWEQTQAFKLLDEIKSIVINSLPGYAEAKWSI